MQEKLELLSPTRAGASLAPTCFGFSEGDTARFLLGTEEGTLYHANRTDRTVTAGSDSRAQASNQTLERRADAAGGTVEGKVRWNRKPGLTNYDTYKGHFGPVTSVHYHPANGPADFSNLVLSTSTDWTAKLWRIKVRAAPV